MFKPRGVAPRTPLHFSWMAGTPAPRQAHFATLALRSSLRSVRAAPLRPSVAPFRLSALNDARVALSAEARSAKAAHSPCSFACDEGASPLGLPYASLGWRGPLHPAKLTSLRSLFAARSAPFAPLRCVLRWPHFPLRPLKDARVALGAEARSPKAAHSLHSFAWQEGAAARSARQRCPPRPPPRSGSAARGAPPWPPRGGGPPTAPAPRRPKPGAESGNRRRAGRRRSR